MLVVNGQQRVAAPPLDFCAKPSTSFQASQLPGVTPCMLEAGLSAQIVVSDPATALDHHNADDVWRVVLWLDDRDPGEIGVEIVYGRIYCAVATNKKEKSFKRADCNNRRRGGTEIEFTLRTISKRSRSACLACSLCGF